ncbi:phosphonates transport ATP-binding protein PhnL [Escherichia coli]|uniref:Phosphonates transport ATP-binding protein PhnL n=1 Tax=Escherichia coli TaxID=562 RepID=A0A376VRW7_ECOLX|nr:phosphonates transport ATP-binding protein PhnL [Escherichia coli]
MINVQNVSKTFILHQQNGVRLPVLQRASLTVNAGECVVLHGHSGSGKSTLLRSLYANYLPDEGQIQIKHGEEWVDLVTAPARKVVEIRKNHHRLGEPVSARHPAYFGTGSGDAASARYRRTA